MSLSFGFFDHINHDIGYNADDVNYLFNGIISDGIFREGRDYKDAKLGIFDASINSNRIEHRNILINNLVTTSYNGITISKNDDGVITANGTYVAPSIQLLDNKWHDLFLISELTLPAGNYWVSDGSDSGCIYILDGNNLSIRPGVGSNVIAKSDGINNIISLVSQTTVYVYFQCSDRNYNNEKYYPMIKVSTDLDKTFVPCGTSTYETIDEAIVTVGTGKALFNGIWVINDDELRLSFADDIPSKLFYVVIEIDKRLEGRKADIKLVFGTDSELPSLQMGPKVFQYAIAKRVISGAEDKLVRTDIPYVENILELPDIHIRNNLTTTEAGYVLDARQGKVIVDNAPFPFAISNGAYGYKKNNVFIPF